MNTLIASLLTFVDQVALGLLVWSWQALVLLACVWAGMKLFRVKTPALRQQIWLISMLAVLSLPLLPPLLPKSTSTQQQHWKGTTMSYAAELPRLVIVPVAEVRSPVMHHKAGSVAPKRYWLPKMLPGVFCLWLGGAFFALLLSACGYLRLRRASRHACPTTPEELGSALELPPSVSLGLSADVRSPVLLGLRHPVILLPHDLVEWTSVEEREAMIAHELAHVARLDHLTNLLPIALKVIFFFHPLVRYACRQFCLEREMACDDRVIEHGADAAMYAESLVKAAERSVKGKLEDLASYSLHQPAFFTSKQALERRIEMILNTERVRVLARGWRYLILPAVLIITVAWILVPNRPTTAQQLQKQLDDAAASVKEGSLKELLGKYMTDTTVYDNLVNTVLSDSNLQMREDALRRLVESEQGWATAALGEIYDRTGDLTLRSRLIGYLGQRRASLKLLALAIEEPNDHLRQQAVQRLLEMEGDDIGGTLVDLYNSVGERAVKESIIRSFGQRGDIKGLAIVASGEKDPALYQLSLQQLEWMAANSQNAETRQAAAERLMEIKHDSVKQSDEAEVKETMKLTQLLSDISIKDGSGRLIEVDVDFKPPTGHSDSVIAKCSDCHTEIPQPWKLQKFNPREFWNDPDLVAKWLREDPNDKNIVMALLRETFNATIRRDTDFLDRVLANEFQSFGPYNEVKNKDQVIAEVNNDNLKFESGKIDGLSLNGEGNSMVATFVGTSFYQEEGKEKRKQYRYTILCLKRRGGWQIVSLHRSPREMTSDHHWSFR
jgi:beta-lactamase regulating signal transducer with metallopeptidase domain